MKRTRSSLFLSTLGLSLVLVLMAGCYRPAAPDVTPTPAEGAEVAPSDEEIVATAAAGATQAAEATVEATEAPPTATPVPPTPVPTAEPTAEPTAVPAPVEATPTPTSPPPSTGGTVTHVVQRGENMFRIALRYGTTVQAIASANGIANPATIYVGQKLIIPSSGAQPAQQPAAGETTYVVQPGDNLFRIALKYNMSHLYLAQYNGIANSSQIYVGQVIRIPPH